MKNQISIMIYVTISVLVLIGCKPDHRSIEANSTALVGFWKLDDITVDWLDRACVVLDFAENDDATFEIVKLNDEELVLKFNNEAHTSWRSKIHRRAFDATQILPTTSVGKVCGYNTAVRVVLRYDIENPDQIEGTWQTPLCSFCPDRVFDAVRVQNN